VYPFNGSATGSEPQSGLVRDASGNLYGTTEFGGAKGLGVVYQIDTSGTEHVLYSFGFNGVDGIYPVGAPAVDSTGTYLYGTTQYGGYYGGSAPSNYCPGNPMGCGAIYRVEIAKHSESLIYKFDDSKDDGSFPTSAFVMDSAGNLYGTTGGGGNAQCPAYSPYGPGCGTVYAITSSGTKLWQHDFDVSDGLSPFAGLVLDPAANMLYGTTVYGGAHGIGTLYSVSTSGAFASLYSFGASGDGAFPFGALALDSAAGVLYGTTVAGGTGGGGACNVPGVLPGCGTIYAVNARSGAETVLYNFTDGADGAQPMAGMVMDPSGNLYGTTALGGPLCPTLSAIGGCGTVFQYSTSAGKETVLHAFNGGDGIYPFGAPVLDPSLNLYGTSWVGGPASYGDVFKYALATPFATYGVQLSTAAGPPATFSLRTTFTQASGAPAIDPTKQGLILDIGTYWVTLPASGFQANNQGAYSYSGTVNNVALTAHITPPGKTAGWVAQITGSGVDLTALTNPPVTLTLGFNTGTATQTGGAATASHKHQP
jgi:uncharacterized repeat protein (TIGR03803 family)